MQILVAAWDAVTTKTVVNCFQKSKMSSENKKASIAENDHPFKELEEEIENLMFNLTGSCFREHGCSFLYRH